MRRRALIIFAALVSTACAYDGDGPGPAYGDYAYEGRDYAGPPRAPFDGDLRGPGLEILDEWLKGTREGRDIVTLGFRDAGEGFVSEEVAHRANIWFRRYADTNRDMKITDPEIRTALVQASRGHRGTR